MEEYKFVFLLITVIGAVIFIMAIGIVAVDKITDKIKKRK